MESESSIKVGDIVWIVQAKSSSEEPHGWSSVSLMPDGRYRLKERKKIRSNVNAVIIEKVQKAATTITDISLDERVYYWCISEAGRLLVDCKFVEPVS